MTDRRSYCPYEIVRDVSQTASDNDKYCALVFVAKSFLCRWTAMLFDVCGELVYATRVSWAGRRAEGVWLLQLPLPSIQACVHN